MKKNLERLSQELLETATLAARSVETMLVGAFQGAMLVEEKSSYRDLVTEYDQNAEEIIADLIMQRHPNSTIIGEEGGSRGTGEINWYVDPIDGTTNFAAGIPFFNVSIGAAVDRRMLAGVIYDPLRRELFSASLQGAFLNGQPIRAEGNKVERNALLLTDFPHPGHNLSGDDFGLYADMVNRFRVVRRLGSSALEIAYVACGRADAAFAVLTNAWDAAAGMLILEQAGGNYVPLEGLTQGDWPPGRYIATCSGFELDQSILQSLLAFRF